MKSLSTNRRADPLPLHPRSVWETVARLDWVSFARSSVSPSSETTAAPVFLSSTPRSLLLVRCSSIYSVDLHGLLTCGSPLIVSSGLLLRVLYRLRTLSEHASFDSTTYAYITPLLTTVIAKGATDGLAVSEEITEQLALVSPSMRGSDTQQPLTPLSVHFQRFLRSSTSTARSVRLQNPATFRSA